MRSALKYGILALTLTATGCGGGGGGSMGLTGMSMPASTGSLLLRVGDTHAQARLSPSAVTFQVEVQSASGADLITPLTVTTASSTIVIPNVPLGSATVIVRGLSPQGIPVSAGHAQVTIAAGDNPVTVTEHLAPVFMFSSFFNTSQVQSFTLNTDTGALTTIGAPVPTQGANGGFLLVDRTQQFLYIGDEGSAQVESFSISSSGALAPVAGSLQPAGQDPQWPVQDASGRFLYFINDGQTPDTISGYALGSQGSLTPLVNPFVELPLGQLLQTVSNGGFANVLAANPVSEALYSSNNPEQSLTTYSVATDGQISILATASFPTPGQPPSVFPNVISVAPSGTDAYVTSFGNSSIVTAPIAANGLIGAGTVQAAGARVNTGVLSPNGRFYYTFNLSDGSIDAFSLDPVTGLPTHLQNVPGSLIGFSANQFADGAVDPTGQFLVAVSNDELVTLQIAADGSLTPLNSASFAGDGLGIPQFSVGPLIP